MSQPVKAFLLKHKWVILICVVGLVHREFIFWKYSHIFETLFDDLATIKYSTPTWQYLTIPALSEHLGKSILYLQQTPPIPNIILGLAVKLFGWPQGTTYFLIFFQMLLSIGTTLVLFKLLTRVTRNQWLSCIISLIFILSTDILVMEYNSFGQTFYENLAMFLLLLTAYYYDGILDTGRPKYAAALGLTVGAMALTRSSFSYFFVVPAFFLFLTPAAAQLKKRLYNVGIYSLCLLCTQFAWCGKNYAVYGTRSVATSSWGGSSLIEGLIETGRRDQVKQFILSEDEKYPAWFIQMVRDKGLSCWIFNSEVFPCLPDEVQKRDQQIQKILQNTNSLPNSVAQRVISDQNMAVCARFYLKNPKIAAAKFLASYRLFWQPIRNYTTMLIDPLSTYPNLVENSFDLIQTIKSSLGEGFCENQFVYHTIVCKGLWGGKKACFFTIPVLPLLMLATNIFAVHVIAPIILISSVIPFLRGRKIAFGRDYFYLLAGFIYASLVINLSEHGENMRYRLPIEPLIWLLSVYSLVIALQFVLALIPKLQSYLKPQRGK